MAKRIVWSIRAKTDRREILEYWHVEINLKPIAKNFSDTFRKP